MIVIPNYSYGDIVNVMLDGSMEPVKILETSLMLESQEIFYKVVLHGKKDSAEFVINESEILTGYGRVPSPSFSVGDVVTFNQPIKDSDGEIDWDIRTGVIEKVFICWDESGYTIYYQTDDTQEGTYTLEDDIISQEDIEEEVISESERVG